MFLSCVTLKYWNSSNARTHWMLSFWTHCYFCFPFNFSRDFSLDLKISNFLSLFFYFNFIYFWVLIQLLFYKDIFLCPYIHRYILFLYLFYCWCTSSCYVHAWDMQMIKIHVNHENFSLITRCSIMFQNSVFIIINVFRICLQFPLWVIA